MLLEHFQKWKFIFHFVDTSGPILLGLKTLRHMGIFVKHPMMYIETCDIHSMIKCRLASQQLEKEERDENQTKYQIASEVPKVVETC